MRNIVIVLTALTILFSYFSPISAKVLKGTIIKVSDGDTVWVKTVNGKKIKIRVWGIDTPEKFKSKKLQKETRVCNTSEKDIISLGKKSSKIARGKLYKKKVRIKIYGRGYYGRFLGKIYINGIDYGLDMIREGYACAYYKAPVEYKQAEKEARKKHKGLWKENFDLMKCLCR